MARAFAGGAREGSDLNHWRPGARSSDIALLVDMPVVPASVLDAARLGVLNAHNGALPSHCGMDAVGWALLHNQPIVCSLHLARPKVDTGEVLATHPVPVAASGTTCDLMSQPQFVPLSYPCFLPVGTTVSFRSTRGFGPRPPRDGSDEAQPPAPAERRAPPTPAGRASRYQRRRSAPDTCPRRPSGSDRPTTARRHQRSLLLGGVDKPTVVLLSPSTPRLSHCGLVLQSRPHPLRQVRPRVRRCGPDLLSQPVIEFDRYLHRHTYSMTNRQARQEAWVASCLAVPRGRRGNERVLSRSGLRRRVAGRGGPGPGRSTAGGRAAPSCSAARWRRGSRWSRRVPSGRRGGRPG
jgi:Formyl transferase